MLKPKPAINVTVVDRRKRASISFTVYGQPLAVVAEKCRRVWETQAESQDKPSRRNSKS